MEKITEAHGGGAVRGRWTDNNDPTKYDEPRNVPGLKPDAGSEILHGYSIIRVTLDDHRDYTVPIGVVAWDTPNAWYRWRWLEQNERVHGVDAATRRLMQIAKNQIQRWADIRRVPYEPTPVEPTSARFWTAVSEILSTCVRLDPPKPMDPMKEAEAGIESLFEAVCQVARPWPGMRGGTVPHHEE